METRRELAAQEQMEAKTLESAYNYRERIAKDGTASSGKLASLDKVMQDAEHNLMAIRPKQGRWSAINEWFFRTKEWGRASDHAWNMQRAFRAGEASAEDLAQAWRKHDAALRLKEEIEPEARREYEDLVRRDKERSNRSPSLWDRIRSWLG